MDERLEFLSFILKYLFDDFQIIKFSIIFISIFRIRNSLFLIYIFIIRFL